MKHSSRSIHLSALGALAVAVIAAGLFSPSRADAEPRTATLVVPPGGLEFRTPEGRMLARLSSRPEGAVLELYDAHEHSTTVWQAGSAGAPAKLGPIEEPEELIDAIRDPWARTSRSVPDHAPVKPRAGVGF